MPKTDQREINIKMLAKIRDDKDNLPAVRLQAVQTMQKLIDKDDPQTKKNTDTLKKLRDSDETGDGVRIQVIQTLQKIIDLVEGEVVNDKPSAGDIMSKIRGTKK